MSTKTENAIIEQACWNFTTANRRLNLHNMREGIPYRIANNKRGLRIGALLNFKIDSATLIMSTERTIAKATRAQSMRKLLSMATVG